MSAFEQIDEADALDADDLDFTVEDVDFVPESGCHVCGAIFGPDDTGHCSPITGGCCLTFASQNAFDRHRTGSRKDGTYRCLTRDELTAKGWTNSGKYDAWRTPAPKSSPWKKEPNS